jgi:hypothetical protein
MLPAVKQAPPKKYHWQFVELPVKFSDTCVLVQLGAGACAGAGSGSPLPPTASTMEIRKYLVFIGTIPGP